MARLESCHRCAAGPDGSAAIQHGSKVKVRLQHPGGWSLDRIPAWAKWATVAPGQMGAKFDGIYWDPPPNEQHQWCAKCLTFPRHARGAARRLLIP